jgi:hypothetical protein
MEKEETLLSIALVPVSNDQVPDLHAALVGGRIQESLRKSSALE